MIRIVSLCYLWRSLNLPPHTKQDTQERMKAVVQNGVFRARTEIIDARLRAFMCLREGVEAHYEVQATTTIDPVSFRVTYIISQVREASIMISSPS